MESRGSDSSRQQAAGAAPPPLPNERTCSCCTLGAQSAGAQSDSCRGRCCPTRPPGPAGQGGWGQEESSPVSGSSERQRGQQRPRQPAHKPPQRHSAASSGGSSRCALQPSSRAHAPCRCAWCIGTACGRRRRRAPRGCAPPSIQSNLGTFAHTPPDSCPASAAVQAVQDTCVRMRAGVAAERGWRGGVQRPPRQASAAALGLPAPRRSAPRPHSPPAAGSRCSCRARYPRCRCPAA